MSAARNSASRSIAAHAVLLTYTLIALFPVFVIVVNSFKNRRAIFADPLALPSSETFDLVGYKTVLAQGDFIIPIPGTKQRKYLEENVKALSITLAPGELAALEAIFPAQATAGLRYPEAVMAMLDI